MFGFTKTTDTYNAKPNQMFGAFTNSFGNGQNVYGVPMDGLEAWWNPEFGVTTSGGRVVTWSDMSGNYTLRPTALSQGNVITGPLYVTGINSVYNQKPYINMDTSAGQNRNLAPSAPNDENWLNQSTDGGYTVIWVVNYIDTISQATPMLSSNGMGLYYDNSVFYRVYGNGVAYPHVGISSPSTNTIHCQAIATDLKSGRFWYSINQNFGAVNQGGATVNRDSAFGRNILTGPSGIINTGTAGNLGRAYIYDMFVYVRIITEAEYRLIYEYIKLKYRL